MQVPIQAYLVYFLSRLCLTKTPKCFGLTKPSSGGYMLLGENFTIHVLKP